MPLLVCSCHSYEFVFYRFWVRKFRELLPQLLRVFLADDIPFFGCSPLIVVTWWKVFGTVSNNSLVFFRVLTFCIKVWWHYASIFVDWSFTSSSSCCSGLYFTWLIVNYTAQEAKRFALGLSSICIAGSFVHLCSSPTPTYLRYWFFTSIQWHFSSWSK